jgi:FMN phosphatase YigB (HAD superfamily)
MIKALLFDLDDTLLSNDMGTFLPAYFQRLVPHFPEVELNRFIQSLMAGTQAMLASTDPTRTLRTVFTETFTAPVNGDAWARFENFYQTDFRQLRSLTAPRPVAREALRWAIDAGYRIVIATNALFPLSAIYERLRWAGVDDLPFEFITHIENSHCAKPKPEYFAEILSRLGVRPGEALMIGNDWSDDIVPATTVGIPVWWITHAARTNGEQPPEAVASRLVGMGDLGAFLDWAQANLAEFVAPEAPPGRIPYQLAGNLAVLAGELATASPDAWTRRPAEGEWSLTEIVCHLRDVEREVHQPRLQAVLTTENPFIPGIDADPWAVERDYQSQSGPQALQEYAAARQLTRETLSAQPAAAWQRPARHAFLGPTTLAEIGGWLLDHDRIHLEQVRKTLVIANSR